MTEFLWLLLVAGGPVLLGAAVAYALLTRRRMTPDEKAARKRATDELYHDRDASQPR